MYQNYNYRHHSGYPIYYDERFGGFAIPFLLGGLGGAAIVGLSRPRPVYYNQDPIYPYQYPYYNY